MSTSTPTQQAQTPIPSAVVLLQAAKLALAQDKPILLDYYVDSAMGKAFLGEDAETKERMLVKSAEEFTSLIQKLYKIKTSETTFDYIVMTENSIYICSGSMPARRIEARNMRHE